MKLTISIVSTIATFLIFQDTTQNMTVYISIFGLILMWSTAIASLLYFSEIS